MYQKLNFNLIMIKYLIEIIIKLYLLEFVGKSIGNKYLLIMKPHLLVNEMLLHHLFHSFVQSAVL